MRRKVREMSRYPTRACSFSVTVSALRITCTIISCSFGVIVSRFLLLLERDADGDPVRPAIWLDFGDQPKRNLPNKTNNTMISHLQVLHTVRHSRKYPIILYVKHNKREGIETSDTSTLPLMLHEIDKILLQKTVNKDKGFNTSL